jgi:hypothetical protein
MWCRDPLVGKESTKPSGFFLRRQSLRQSLVNPASQVRTQAGAVAGYHSIVNASRAVYSHPASGKRRKFHVFAIDQSSIFWNAWGTDLTYAATGCQIRGPGCRHRAWCRGLLVSGFRLRSKPPIRLRTTACSCRLSSAHRRRSVAKTQCRAGYRNNQPMAGLDNRWLVCSPGMGM